MKFDTLIIAPCHGHEANQPAECSIGNDSTGGTGGDNGGDNNHQEIELVLKPESALLQVGESVQFKAYARNATQEVLITNGVTYRSNDQAMVAIGAIGGSATGTRAGITTISAEWQDKIAYSRVEVVGDCSDVTVGMLLCVDRSKSMGAPFTVPPATGDEPVYPKRLDLAKHLAKTFAGEVNETKDWIGLMTFDTAQTVTPLTQAKATIEAAANAITLSTGRTDLYGALFKAIAQLNATVGLDKKVIVLISDGENKLGSDPLPLAESFKQSGGTIVCVGIRSYGENYTLLQNIATSGMFINALEGNAASSSLQLSGLKGYFCAGNCTPPGGECVSIGQLNYTGFAQWDVTGQVDLVGMGTQSATYDLIPGHGLYADMAGSSAPYPGKLTTKNEIVLPAGHQILVRFKLAGNQRFDGAANPLFDPCIVKADIGLGSLTVEESSWSQDFTEYSFQVTGDGLGHKLSFETIKNIGYCGMLLDDISVVDATSGATLFSENFDNENVYCLPPACGENEYGYGYDCYGSGCLDEPVSEQGEDPDPPADLEA